MSNDSTTPAVRARLLAKWDQDASGFPQIPKVQTRLQAFRTGLDEGFTEGVGEAVDLLKEIAIYAPDCADKLIEFAGALAHGNDENEAEQSEAVEKVRSQKKAKAANRELYRKRKGTRTGLPKTSGGLVIPPAKSLAKIKHGANPYSRGTRPATIGELAMLQELPQALDYLMQCCQTIKMKPTGNEPFRVWDEDGVHVHEYSVEALERVRLVYNALNWRRPGTEIESFWEWNTHQAFYKALLVATSDKGARGGINLEIPEITSAHTAVKWVRKSSPLTPDSLTRELFQAALDRATLKDQGGGRGGGRRNWDAVANELIGETKKTMTCMLSPNGERVPEAYWQTPRR